MASIARWRRRSGQKNLEQKLSALQDDLTRLQRDLRGLAVAGGESAASRLADALDATTERARGAAERAGEQMDEWTDGGLDTMRDQVKNRPLTSVLISVGAGALVGLLLAAPRLSRED